MRLLQRRLVRDDGWEHREFGENLRGAQLVMAFGSGELLRDNSVLEEIRLSHPKAQVVGCSTAGEICGTRVFDDSLVVTAVELERSHVEVASTSLQEAGSSFEAGAYLSRALPHDGLVHVFVLSDGIAINGSELVRGLSQGLPPNVRVSGGLSGDGDRFRETLVLLNDAPRPGEIAAVGFYGALRVGLGSLGGWDAFGPERVVTRSDGNVLYELDERPALALYKEYLGDHAAELPASALLFPLTVRTDGAEPVVRTILGVDEATQSMRFAGDIPEGAYARLMRANFDRLIDGAVGAAQSARLADGQAELAVLISCVGRKMVLGQRIEEEVEGVREVLGDSAVLTGFYSYGEISPFTPSARCELHNQTMTITTFSERGA
jgi:hypothetical protein